MKNESNDVFVPCNTDVKGENNRTPKKIIILSILIAILAILLIYFGIHFFTSSSGGGGNYTNNDLFVVHSKANFGDEIKSFKEYNSYDNAFYYTFYVENQNKMALYYRVKLVDDFGNYSGKRVNKNNINYAVLKNDEMIFKGKLNGKKENELVKTKINYNQVDNYKIKLWINNGSDGYYKFKVDVGI